MTPEQIRKQKMVEDILMKLDPNDDFPSGSQIIIEEPKNIDSNQDIEVDRGTTVEPESYMQREPSSENNYTKPTSLEMEYQAKANKLIDSARAKLAMEVIKRKNAPTDIADKIATESLVKTENPYNDLAQYYQLRNMPGSEMYDRLLDTSRKFKSGEYLTPDNYIQIEHPTKYVPELLQDMLYPKLNS